jgi:small-conductance mechanosensitive channel
MNPGFHRLTLLLAAVLVTQCASGQNSPAPVTPPTQDPTQIVQFLSRTISWYRQLAVEQQIATEPSDLSYVQENRRVADQIVQIAFDYARSQERLQAKQKKGQQSTAAADASQSQRLTQVFEKTEQQLQNTQNELQDTQEQLTRAPASKRAVLQAQVAELQSEIGLLQARRDVLQTMIEFVVSSNAGKSGLDLRAQIEELARSVPASLSHPQGTSAEATPEPAANTNASQTAKRSEPTGIWGLTADLIHLSEKRHTLQQEIAATEALKQRAVDFRKPILDDLRGLIKQGDVVFAAADNSGVAQLSQEKQQLDTLTAQFKQTSAVLLPLSKIGVLLDIYGRTLSNWRESIRAQSREELRELLLRVGLLAVLIGVVFAVGELWRKTTFRYVHDGRRRYQFLLLRRVVMWIAILIIIVLTFATQLGSAVTFAGLITAGVAVALQNVIVSVVAYFFLIGKYGIRVGDRVQIAAVTGEVVDIGLVRMHIMELGGPGDSQPTGRVVAFSNSIVFQPSGVFKQIPGTNFIWHEMKLTLASETDYHTARERITKTVQDALEEYKPSIEAQRQMMERSLSTITPAELHARVRLHYTAAGIEVTVRFPVELGKAAEMDERLMKEVLASLDREPKLKLVSAEMSAAKLD